jgi:choline-glycine betaine transporter
MEMTEWLNAAIVLFIYMMPTMIAFMRGHASRWAIGMVNLFLGWTVFFWFWSMIWALANPGASQTVVINNHNESR